MLSYLIVIPRLSAEVNSYGIYSVVISLLIFLQYADLGFLGAGQKYAAESYAKNERDNEIKILGFVHFILIIVVLLYVLLLVFVYFNPGSFINAMNAQDETLAKNLILIFICSSPIIVLQRLSSAIFTIRLEEYILQYFEITSSIIKILSTFYFFRNGHYEIINYVIFIQFMNIVSVVCCLIVTKYRYNYSMIKLIYGLRFQKSVYDLTKMMALASVVQTIAYMLYFEFDLIYIGKLYNPKIVALFAIGVIMLNFSRSFMNAFFGPWLAKLNHLRGLSDNDGIDRYFFLLVEWALPISFFPALAIIIMMHSIIISWIGTAYIDSLWINRLLISTLFFSFLNVPINYFAMAKEKFRFLLITSLFLPLFYFTLFFFLYDPLGYFSFPTAKLLTIVLQLIIITYLLRNSIAKILISFIIKRFKYLILPLLTFLSILSLLYPYWGYPSGISTFFFLRVVCIGGISSLLSITLYYLINPNTRVKVLHLISLIRFNSLN